MHVAEECGELVRVHRGRGHDELHVAPPRDDLLEDAEEDVGVERSLVRLVHDDGRVRVEVGRGERLA